MNQKGDEYFCAKCGVNNLRVDCCCGQELMVYPGDELDLPQGNDPVGLRYKSDCICGVDSIGLGKHSDWCAKGE